jgi:hypothetical protein
MSGAEPGWLVTIIRMGRAGNADSGSRWADAVSGRMRQTEAAANALAVEWRRNRLLRLWLVVMIPPWVFLRV